MMFANHRAGDKSRELWLHSRLAVYRWEVGMSNRGCDRRVMCSLVIVCVAVAGVLSMMTPAFVSGVKAIIAEAKLLADEGWIMSGTDVPTPDNGFLSSVESLYLSQDSAYTFDPLTTPEQFCPIVCIPASRTWASATH